MAILSTDNSNTAWVRTLWVHSSLEKYSLTFHFVSFYIEPDINRKSDNFYIALIFNALCDRWWPRRKFTMFEASMVTIQGGTKSLMVCEVWLDTMTDGLTDDCGIYRVCCIYATRRTVKTPKLKWLQLQLPLLYRDRLVCVLQLNFNQSMNVFDVRIKNWQVASL